MTKFQWLGAVVVGSAAAIVVFLGLLQAQHWRQDEATLHQMVQLLNYNVATGKLAAMPDPQAPPAPAPAPPTGPEHKP